jgi:hypothetical protein
MMATPSALTAAMNERCSGPAALPVYATERESALNNPRVKQFV